MIPTSSITGLILCGGAGSRLGGIDKGLANFHGVRLVDIAIAGAAELGDEIDETAFVDFAAGGT
ncbi:MAG: molybdenum cofactor guanylyltransferase, partial [Burkholderiaceae bacterium]